MIDRISTSQEDAWFKAFEDSLASLPPDDNHQIVREIRQHLQERLTQGQNAAQILASFGSPSAYARSFVDEFALTRARDSKRTLTMITTVAGFASRSLIACAGLFCALMFALLITGSSVCFMIKMIRPGAVGLWVDLPLSAQHRYVHIGPRTIPLRIGNDHIQFGYSNPLPLAPEVLGGWMFPCLIGLALLGYCGLRFTLLRTLGRLSRRRL